MMLVSLGLGVAIAVALIAVVSALTGGKVTNSNSNSVAVLPTTDLVGKHVAAFTLDALDGGQARAPWAAHRASVLIFFASWCPPCQGEIPKVAAYLRSHDTSPVAVLGMDANDERGAALKFLKKDGVAFPVAFDANGTVTSSEFGFAQLPETVFVSAKGVVESVHFGAISTKQLAAGIAKLKKA